jgi:hypothetical protein
MRPRPGPFKRRARPGTEEIFILGSAIRGHEGAKFVQAMTHPESIHPTVAFFRDYWERKRGPRRMPARSDIVASELREHLSWVILLDVLNGGEDFRYRLVGTLVAQYFMVEGTGRTVKECFRPDTPEAMRNAVLELYRCVARERKVFSCALPAGFVGPRTEACDLILLPLSDDGETVNVILEAFVFNRDEVLMSREIAKVNGGILPELAVRN